MVKISATFSRWLLLGCLGLAAVGCHADPDDPAGQAEELADPVRREFAMSNLARLYGKALTANQSDRDSEGVQAFHDATVEALVKTYIDNPMDTQNGGAIMNLMFEMRDPRTLPALLKALEWRTEVNEQHAITAAKTLAVLEPDLTAAQKTEAAKKLADALDRVSGKRPVDNRMRIEFLRAIGALADPAATPVLIRVATRQAEEQNFLINNLAVEQLGLLADPEAVEPLIECLLLFDPNNPAQRLNQAAPAALVRIGKPALDPLLKLLAGEHEGAKAIATQLIAAIKERAPEAAAKMSPEGEMAIEAANALGVLGYPEATGPLIAKTSDEDERVALGAAVALASLNRREEDTGRIRKALIDIYEKQPKPQKMQVLRAMQHLYDAGSQDFLLKVATTPEQELPDINIIAMNAYSLLANKAEAKKAQAAIARDKSPFKATFEKQNNKLLAAAVECDEKLDCWAVKLKDDDEAVARKAAYMLGRLGRGNAAAVDMLVEQIDHPEEMVRGDVLSALDFVATEGSKKGAEKIEKLREEEEGRAIWSHIKERALATQAKLTARAQ